MYRSYVTYLEGALVVILAFWLAVIISGVLAHLVRLVWDLLVMKVGVWMFIHTYHRIALLSHDFQHCQ